MFIGMVFWGLPGSEADTLKFIADMHLIFFVGMDNEFKL